MEPIGETNHPKIVEEVITDILVEYGRITKIDKVIKHLSGIWPVTLFLKEEDLLFEHGHLSWTSQFVEEAILQAHRLKDSNKQVFLDWVNSV